MVMRKFRDEIYLLRSPCSWRYTVPIECSSSIIAIGFIAVWLMVGQISVMKL